jgi:hypothetical protein
MPAHIAVIVHADEVKVFSSEPDATAVVVNAKALIDEGWAKEDVKTDIAEATQGLQQVL